MRFSNEKRSAPVPVKWWAYAVDLDDVGVAAGGADGLGPFLVVVDRFALLLEPPLRPASGQALVAQLQQVPAQLGRRLQRPPMYIHQLTVCVVGRVACRVRVRVRVRVRMRVRVRVRVGKRTVSPWNDE